MSKLNNVLEYLAYENTRMVLRYGKNWEETARLNYSIDRDCD